jgi:hypothetical protein
MSEVHHCVTWLSVVTFIYKRSELVLVEIRIQMAMHSGELPGAVSVESHDGGSDDFDMPMAMESENEQDEDEEAEQIYAQQLLDSEANDEDVHAREAKNSVENRIEVGQHAMVCMSAPASASSDTALTATTPISKPQPEWFTHSADGIGPQQQMFNLADKRGDEVFVASDVIGSNKGTKKYASMGNHMELAVQLDNCNANNNYEVIRKDCKLYLDSELDEEHFQDNSRLTSVVDELDSKIRVSHAE